jgi:hypothetical protein
MIRGPDDLPDVLEWWAIHGRSGRRAGRPTCERPRPYLPLAAELGHIKVQGERYMIRNPWLNIACFCWLPDDDIDTR